MRTMSAGPAALQVIAGHSLSTWLSTTLKRWWAAYMSWRIEQAAIAQLWSMSDRQLKDIGLVRSDITGRYRAFNPHIRTSSGLLP